jgi:hypothetical protein
VRLHAHAHAALALALLLSARGAAGQDREFAVRGYRFVSDIGDDAGLWVNPAAGGFNMYYRPEGHVSFQRSADEEWFTAQYLIGFQAGPVAFGYAHDEYEAGEGFAQSDAYTLTVGYAVEGSGFGVARTWRTVGDTEGSWDVGYSFMAPDLLSFGLAWRDIGSPVVRGATREERLVGAVTVRGGANRFSVSAQGDYATDARDFRGFRIGGSARIVATLEVAVSADWDGEGEFIGLNIGAYLHKFPYVASAVAGLYSEGDVRAGHAAVAYVRPVRM